ncbi:unnamed protein product [Didymodactylos carnosus]|uniref:Uncharacterized protein n=1 Tax=Didymodactylos carnosus TaxID=1234261 RepID=A0A8S2NG91_9BILA|nr:unnamed protein product [Didymodactylos carnosus]CAF3999572.1 unnamed protein product [Didymodactylos carnosus]
MRPLAFDLKTELTDILQNNTEVRQQLTGILSVNSTTVTSDLNSNMGKILDLLEPVMLKRLDQRLKEMANQIVEMENRLDAMERYNISYNIRLLNVSDYPEEDPVQVTVDIANEHGFQLDYSEIETAYRVPVANSKSNTNRAPVLIARLYSRSCRYDFLTYKQMFKTF